MPRARHRTSARRSFAPLTARLPLGTRGLAVSPFCQGMALADPDIISAAFDAGVNFFFLSSDLHWPYYESARRGLARLLARGGGIRDRVVVVGCTYASRGGFASAAWKELIDAVPGLERLDVLAMGGLVDYDAGPRLHELAAALARASYGARAIAASFHERTAAALAHRGQLVDLAFVRHNADHPGGERDLFPFLGEQSRTLLFNFKSTSSYRDAATIARLGVPADTWRPRFVDHYRFALSAPRMDGILGALTERAHIGELTAALAEGPLDETEQSFLVNLGRVARGEVELA